MWRGGNGGGLRRKPQTWLRDGPIGHRSVDFFPPASVMRTLEDQIEHRHEKLASGGDKQWGIRSRTKAHQANGTAKSQSGTLVSVMGSLAR